MEHCEVCNVVYLKGVHLFACISDVRIVLGIGHSSRIHFYIFFENPKYMTFNGFFGSDISKKREKNNHKF